MFKLLVILFMVKLYARNNIFNTFFLFEAISLNKEPYGILMLIHRLYLNIELPNFSSSQNVYCNLLVLFALVQVCSSLILECLFSCLKVLINWFEMISTRKIDILMYGKLSKTHRKHQHLSRVTCCFLV